MVETTPEISDSGVESVIASFSEADLWSPDKIRPLFALGTNYKIQAVIDRKRREFALKKAIRWLESEIPIQEVYRSEAYDDFAAMMADIDDTLEEYERTRREVRQLHDLTAPLHRTSEAEQNTLTRFIELEKKLQSNGIIIERWVKLCDILTNFELATRTTDIASTPINSIENEMLEPTATYLASSDIHNSYLTRFFAQCFLVRLKDDVLSRAKSLQFLKKYWAFLLIIGAGLTKFAGGWMITEAADYWLISLAVLLAIGVSIRGLWRQAKAIRILERLTTDFGLRTDRSVIDGRVLKRELANLERLGLTIPSLLFSLFDLTVPGY